MTRGILGLILTAALTVALASCGGRAAKHSAAGASAPSMAPPAATGTPRDQIVALDQHINRLRSRAGMPAMESGSTTDGAADAGAAAPTTAGTAPRPMGAGTAASTCQDVCNISRAICDDAGRICRIADGDLAGDAWAADMCKRAQTSCADSKKRCTDCKSG